MRSWISRYKLGGEFFFLTVEKNQDIVCTLIQTHMIYIIYRERENMPPAQPPFFLFDCYTTHYHIISACPLSSTADSIEIRQKRKPEGLELGSERWSASKIYLANHNFFSSFET